MELTFEECNLADLDKLNEISRVTFLSTYGKYNSAENIRLYLENAFSAESLTQQLEDEFSEFYFANVGDRTIGYLKLNMGDSQSTLNDSASLEVERIYVIPEYQGNGFGEMFLRAIVDVAKSRKLNYIWVGVWEKNDNAISFYQKFGFQNFGSHVFELGNEKQTDHLLKYTLT